MAINFPNSPQAGDPHSEAGIDWVYDGEKWVAQSEATFWARTNSTLSPSTAGDNISTTGDLTAGCTTTGTSGSSGEAKVVGYQQGIWSPKMGSTNGDSTHTFTGTVGIWTRIGNQVTIHFQVEIATVGANGTGIAGVTGLPYIPETTNSYSGVVNYAANFDASFNPIALRSSLGGSYEGFAFYKYELATGHSNIGTGRYNVGTVVSANAIFITDDTTWTPLNGATIS